VANTPKPLDPFTIPMTKLVIFHLLRTGSADYDDVVELMIAAESEAEARTFAETAQGAQDPSVWHHPSVEVRYMGIAFEDTEPGIFLEKFNG
jgi:hypothetical protein